MIISILSISQGTGKSEAAADYCPFSYGDTAYYIIYGYWEGKNITLENGNNAGIQKLVVLNRTSSNIVIFEEKVEDVNWVYHDLTYNWTIHDSSYWIINTTTRGILDFETYTCWWIETDKINMVNSSIKIFNYIFHIVEKRSFEYLEQSRTAYVATYNESYEDPIFGFHKLSNELWYDTQTGLMVKYIVRFYSFENQGKIIGWSYYSTSLTFTTINLTETIEFSDTTPISKQALIGFPFLGLVIPIVVLLVILRLKQNWEKTTH